ncbi:hypothetical protein [Streptomyces mirabilis]|uniref:hypothetical protein n=1 Tax=Streptomyces mirabilis TaxID=68239 RepID=UPI00364A79E1
MAEPDNGDDPAPNNPGSPRHWTPFSITTAVAIPLLAIAASVIVALTASSSGDSKSGAAPSPTATATGSGSALLDPCLFGMWIQQDSFPKSLTLTDNSVVQPVNRTGSASVNFGSDGHGEIVANLWLTGTHDGKSVELNITGRDTFTYAVRDSTVHYDSTSKGTQQILYIDSKKVLSKPLKNPLHADQATCTQTRLTLANVDSTTHFDRPAP